MKTLLAPQDNQNTNGHILILFILMIVMLIIRIVPVYGFIFTDWATPDGNFVNFAADDAVYHMRLVHNTLQHFPLRIFFDPFTHFPFGNQIHFAPLFTLLIAFPAWLLGAGHPSAELINHVGAYVPTVLGALCILPIYFTAKKIFNKNAGLFAALVIAFLPGEFLKRSTLGFTDHHVAEVLFSAITVAYLIFAVDYAKNIALSFKWEKPLIYSLLSGIAYGLYLLNWIGGMMFLPFFFAFLVLQLLIEYHRKESFTYLIYIALFLFTIPALMILPFSFTNLRIDFFYYSIAQPILLFGALGSFAICYLAASILKKHQAASAYLPITLGGLALLVILMTRLFAPTVFDAVYTMIENSFSADKGLLTVAEHWPMFINRVTGGITFAPLWDSFLWGLPFAILGGLLLVLRIIKNKKPSEVLFFVCTLGVFCAAALQCRYAYYLAANVAILAGIGIALLLKILSLPEPSSQLLQMAKKWLIISVAVICIFLIAFPLMAAFYTRQIQSGPRISREWYDMLIWLKTNTPDPQGRSIAKDFDYKKGLYPVPADPDARYPYPKSAYGIMSWWDYGHQITYISERIPNANPFQMGIREENNTAGAAPFFTATNVTAAVNNLESMGSRYIMIDLESAAGKFDAIEVWANNTNGWIIPQNLTVKNGDKTMNLRAPFDSDKFSSSITSRLFYKDCDGLSNFRLVYESEGNFMTTAKLINLANGQVNRYFNLPFSSYKESQQLIDSIRKNGYVWLNNNNAQQNSTILIYDARPATKFIKIFEKVKGANIVGSAATGAEINMSLKLSTPYDREFTYSQKTVAKDNKFQITAPYPTEKMAGDGYSYDILPQGKYMLTIGGRKLQVAVPETAVMNGETIRVN